MVQRIGGARRKTRQKFAKPIREKGKLPLSKYFQKVEIGQKVCLTFDSASQRAGYHPRFHGKVGTVLAKLGRSYEVGINDLGKEKRVIVHPVHFTRQK